MASPHRASTASDTEPLPAYTLTAASHELAPDDHNASVSEQQAAGPGAAPPPAYTDVYGTLDISQNGLDTSAQIADDGRVNIRIDQKTRRIANFLSPALSAQFRATTPVRQPQPQPGLEVLEVPEFARQVPALNILIQIIGSRGDVQPFIALGKVLRERYAHRVRVATHPTFRGFVEENGLEFFSLGGDPSELMAFMVKNPGLMPGLDSLKSGDVTKRRKGMWDVLLGGWRACIEPGDGMSYAPATEGAMAGQRPFVADAIIANPPSFGHIHCAEKLGVPLHLMFTMPYSPTSAFPHPLANIEASNAEPSVTNFLSYVLVEMMTWQGLGDLVNKFREKTLGLEPVSTMWAPGMISRLKVPHTYCWSPALIPKPADWPAQINVSGFYFLSLANNFTPERELADFLAAGPPPVYIGFGSIVVDDPNALTAKIFAAVQSVGCRALVSKGWGGIGGEQLDIPENVMLLGNVPHDWLFPHCSAVVHHGGAGTTAAGIRCGKPTVIVPFFGDQPFWGAMVSRAGAGPDPVPHSTLTAENLAAAITHALAPATLLRAEELGAKIRDETGADNGARSFHASLDELGLARCDILGDRVAVWKLRAGDLKLSALAASILVERDLIDGGFQGLRLWRHKEWPVDEGPYEPISGGAGAILGTMGSVMMGVGDFPKDAFRVFAGGKDKGKGKGKAPATAAAAGSTESFELDAKSPASVSTESVLSTGKNESALSVADIGASASRSTTPEPPKRTVSENIETALGASKGLSKIVGASLRSPMDFTMGLAQGFRNAPRLYGDDTVRPAERVTGFHSGLKAAGKELSLGLYDGITGLITQPLRGAREEGAAGLMKGAGKGIGGLVLKGGAAMWGVPGYAMKGIHQEFLKLSCNDNTAFITAARAAQGAMEARDVPAETRTYVVNTWAHLPASARTGASAKEKWLHRVRSPSFTTQAAASAPAYTAPPSHPDPEVAELDAAIRASVEQTSRGNAGEDAAIERAMRASIAELQRPSAAGDDETDDAALRRAITASIAEHPHTSDPETQEELETAIRMSLQRPSIALADDAPPLSPLPPLPMSPRDEEGDLQLALQQSRTASLPPRATGAEDEDDEELQRAIAASKAHDAAAADDEEDDVELRQALERSRTDERRVGMGVGVGVHGHGDGDGDGDGDADAELARAVRESLRLQGEEERREQAMVEAAMRASLCGTAGESSASAWAGGAGGGWEHVGEESSDAESWGDAEEGVGALSRSGTGGIGGVGVGGAAGAGEGQGAGGGTGGAGQGTGGAGQGAGIRRWGSTGAEWAGEASERDWGKEVVPGSQGQGQGQGR